MGGSFDERPEHVAGGVAGTAVPQTFGEVRAAVPFFVPAFVGLECPRLEEEELPPRKEKADVEREGKLVVRRLEGNGLAGHEERVDRMKILVGHPGEVVVGKGRIQMPAPAVNAFAHGAPEGRLRPGADPGPRVRRDVRRVDDAEGRRQRPPAREGRAAVRGVAHHACADPGERLALAKHNGVKGPFARRLDRLELRVPIGPGKDRQHDERRRRAEREPGTPPPRHHPSPPLKGEPPAPRSADRVRARPHRARGSGTPASRARVSRRAPPSCTSGTCGAATPSSATSGGRRGTR